MAELGQQTVDFSALVGRTADESFLSLKEVVENAKSRELSDTDEKVSLLKYIVKTQQRMLRLNALANWCKQQARAPVYDVPSAVEILLTGSYQRLPKCVGDVGMQCSLDERQHKPALRKLEVLVRSKLLEITLKTSRPSNQMQQTQGTIVPSTLTAPNDVASPAPGPLDGSFHGVTGRSGPGIVPRSLLPIDVSVVLRGPYWIRIIYRKRFAVDMRCFAGDQVWLQPATPPPKGGASVGGSLPCPQFRPFIMEHVAQELNGLEPNLNSANPNWSGGNRAKFTASSAMSRAMTSRVVGSVASGLSVR